MRFATRALMVVAAIGLTACAEDDDAGSSPDSSGTGTGSPDLVGQVCEAPADCYSGVDPAELGDDVLCLDRVQRGYCTHECSADDECCAVEGECVSDFPQVCAPFESTGMMMCFLSCEEADIEASKEADDSAFCQKYASPDFICRSTGGGSANRKVCVPGECGVGSRCGSDDDCDADLECISEIDGGYCGRRDCETNADCPGESVCIDGEDFDYCARPCEAESDCTFCRLEEHFGSCVGDAPLVEGGTAAVCLVP